MSHLVFLRRAHQTAWEHGEKAQSRPHTLKERARVGRH